MDPVTRLPIPSISLSLDDSSPPSSLFTISGPAGPFHTLKTTLTFLSPLLPSLTSFSVLLSAQPSSRTDTLSEVSSRMRSIIGEDQQELLESWEGQRYVLMRALSGAVEIRSGKKGSEASTSIDKGETCSFAYRLLELTPSSVAKFKRSTVTFTSPRFPTLPILPNLRLPSSSWNVRDSTTRLVSDCGIALLASAAGYRSTPGSSACREPSSSSDQPSDLDQRRGRLDESSWSSELAAASPVSPPLDSLPPPLPRLSSPRTSK